MYVFCKSFLKEKKQCNQTIRGAIRLKRQLQKFVITVTTYKSVIVRFLVTTSWRIYSNCYMKMTTPCVVISVPDLTLCWFSISFSCFVKAVNDGLACGSFCQQFIMIWYLEKINIPNLVFWKIIRADILRQMGAMSRIPACIISCKTRKLSSISLMQS